MKIERIAQQNGIKCVVKKGKSATRISMNNGTGWAEIIILHKEALSMKKIKLVFAYRSLRNMSQNPKVKVPYCKEFVVENFS